MGHKVPYEGPNVSNALMRDPTNGLLRVFGSLFLSKVKRWLERILEVIMPFDTCIEMSKQVCHQLGGKVRYCEWRIKCSRTGHIVKPGDQYHVFLKS